jgi:hypothetical protein
MLKFGSNCPQNEFACKANRIELANSGLVSTSILLFTKATKIQNCGFLSTICGSLSQLSLFEVTIGAPLEGAKQPAVWVSPLGIMVATAAPPKVRRGAEDKKPGCFDDCIAGTYPVSLRKNSQIKLAHRPLYRKGHWQTTTSSMCDTS